MPNRTSITGSELFMVEKFQGYTFHRSDTSIEYGVTGIKRRLKVNYPATSRRAC